jgi:excisionase family DNA binding protein
MRKATYTLPEAAKLLSCHTETIRRAIRDGVIMAARLGREYRLSRMELERFWQERGGGKLFDESGLSGGEDEFAADPAQASFGAKRRAATSDTRQLSLLGDD